MSVPKCACSSLKRYFYEVDTGTVFEDRDKTGEADDLNIHNFYPSRRFEDMNTQSQWRQTTLAVVREPVSRIVSCYKNRVFSGFYLRQNGVAEACERRKLPVKPDLQTFVMRLAEYQDVSQIIRQHARPLAFFLGQNPDWYSAIFDISQLHALERLVKRKTKSKAEIPHFNRSVVKISPEMVTSEIRQVIQKMYAEDVTLFGKWMRFSD